MNKTELLFIRACKSCKPKRLKSVYRRFYLKYYQDACDNFILNILTDICDKYLDVSLSKFIQDVNHEKVMDKMLNNKRIEIEIQISVVRNYIAFADIDKFPGYIAPCRFRNLPF
jgi:hypothetical protein